MSFLGQTTYGFEAKAVRNPMLQTDWNSSRNKRDMVD